MARVSSYDKDAPLPIPGSRWVWEVDSPGACCLIEVIEVRWNGEEWWIRTRRLWDATPGPLRAPASVDPIALNDLNRFWEACSPIGSRGSRPKGVTFRRPDVADHNARTIKLEDRRVVIEREGDRELSAGRRPE